MRGRSGGWTTNACAVAVLGAAMGTALGAASCSRTGQDATRAGSDSTATVAAAIDTSKVEIVNVDGAGVMSVVKQHGSPLVLVNVWATWCAPCREEFPDLMRVAREREAKGLGMVLVSADFEDQVGAAKRFLASQGAGFKSYMKTGDDMKFIGALSDQWSGALPATFLFDRTGHLIDFWEGRAPYDDMTRRVDRALDVARATLPS